jgi:hypothetical protein
MSTSEFNALERAALNEIANQYPVQCAGLKAQFTAAKVQSRENTGAGFYTWFAVDRTMVAAVSCDRIIGYAGTNIEGFDTPMTFLLFTTDGYADCLEGASVTDCTTGIDFSAIKFELMQGARFP